MSPAGRWALGSHADGAEMSSVLPPPQWFAQRTRSPPRSEERDTHQDKELPTPLAAQRGVDGQPAAEPKQERLVAASCHLNLPGAPLEGRPKEGKPLYLESWST